MLENRAIMMSGSVKNLNAQLDCESILDVAWDKIEDSITDAKDLLSNVESYLSNETDKTSQANKVKYKIVQASILTRGEYHEEAFPIILKASQNAKVLDNKWQIRLYNILGLSYALMGERALGLEQFEKMWQIAIEEKDAHNEALALHDIASLFDKPDYFLKAKELWQSTGYQSGVMACLRNMAFSLLNKKPKPTAEDVQEAISLSIEAIKLEGSSYRHGSCHHILAEAYAYQNNAEESLKHIKLFKEFFEEAGVLNSDLCIVNEASVFHILEEHETVIALAKKALDLKAAKSIQQIIYDLLAKSYAGLNNYEQAYYYQGESYKIKDEIHDEENIRKTRMLKVVHETDIAKQKAIIEQEKARALHTYIDKLERLNTEIKEISLRDPLTGLFNRRYLMDELRSMVETTILYQRNLSLAILDADHFKQVNDTFGHIVGDEVLKVIAQILKDEPRKSDFAARYGGEEFTIVLPETNVRDAVVLCERIRLKIQDYPWHTIATDLSVTVSMGISQFEDNMTQEGLLHLADDMLYQAKEAGRNCVKVSGS